MTNVLRGLCIMSAWHFIDLIQGEGEILGQFSEHPNVSSRDTSSHIPGGCSAGYSVYVLKKSHSSGYYQNTKCNVNCE